MSTLSSSVMGILYKMADVNGLDIQDQKQLHDLYVEEFGEPNLEDFEKAFEFKTNNEITVLVHDFEMSGQIGGDDLIATVDQVITWTLKGYSIHSWYGENTEVLILAAKPKENLERMPLFEIETEGGEFELVPGANMKDALSRLEDWQLENIHRCTVKLSNEEMIERMIAICENEEWDFRDHYSGRGMFGQSCVGVVTSEPLKALSMIGYSGAKMDSMGLKTIIYWPNLCIKDE